ncbi:hypothetical protein FCM35_KLT14199 [Carex littledalei]|uniref:Uncharacterized protein n=1 Tax=Carex littledalei TaxID=544730 RepID=A0A833QLU2_9POAL|nr:hypothetical protein FCM35_KLT14199 [Carex littledalei]
MDEKWKLSKKESRSYNGSNKAFCGDNGLCLKRSMTLKERQGTATSTGRSFSGRCARLVKEQRARMYKACSSLISMALIVAKITVTSLPFPIAQFSLWLCLKE